jgi:hypothetical protein
MAFQLTSAALRSGETVPTEFTADGRNVSPPLAWSEPPPGTQSFALLCDDPDAPRGTFTHWVVFDLPANLRELSENVPHQANLAGGGVQTHNDFGKIGYGGPSPPSGKPHHYHFKLFALDRKLDLPPGAGKEQVRAAMQGHVLAEAEIVAIYGRSR